MTMITLITHRDLPDAGTIPHHVIDQQLGQFNDRLIRLQVKTDNVSNPPTDAELDTAFGTPAAVGAGFLGIVDDNGAGSNVWLCVSDGANWWVEALTKAL